MSEKTVQSLQDSPSARSAERSRIFPLAMAVVVCSGLAFALGYGSWYFFGTHNKIRIESPLIAEKQQIETNKTVPAANTQIEVPAASPAVEMPAAPKIEGVVKVDGSEFTTGGGDTNRPVRRSIIENFSIAETEVTNAQYAEFVRETNYQSPAGWNKGTFPDGAENYPVVDVSWQDASDYCEWLGKKLEMTVRLPSEAEWELAARGKERLKYPWGNEWNKEAAISGESGGKISAVKSFSVNRSPYGAYDMAGNVWEWTRDKVSSEDVSSDEALTKLLKSGQVLRVVKGGTAKDPAKQISAQARYEMPETMRHPHIGFRYVITPR